MLNRYLDKNIDLFSCDAEKMLPGIDPAVLEFHAQNTPPHKVAENPLHGTHVAGTITYQNENLKIVPVRVLTRGVVKRKKDKNKLRVRFLKDFRNWLKKPLVKRAVYDYTVDLIPELKSTELSDDQKYEALYRKLVAPALKKFKGDDIDFEFLYEVEEAIRYMGEKKVKIANISLGTEFTNAPTYRYTSANANFRVIFEFLKFEFFKYYIAENALKRAPGTLFVIAAGNSGKWVDGKTRSALPCDISSNFLNRYERPGEIAPNNELKNILCIGSLNPKGKISSFSNLLVTDLPYIFARGESILAPVTTMACDGSNQAFDKEFGSMEYPYPGIEDESEIMEVLFDIGFAKKGADKVEVATEFKEILKNTYSAAFDMEKKQYCAKDWKPHAYLTGTSMASPSVAGYIADRAQKKMVAKGLSSDGIYLHADFSPQKLISDLIADLPTYGGKSVIRDIPVVHDIKLRNEEVK